MSIYQSPEMPDLRDVLTDDGHELPPVRLTPTQRAVVDDAMRRAYHLTCTCGHDIDDHQPVHDVWLIGARTVTETREQCAKCDCDDFEEETHG